jgi:hypothetical protein
VSSSFSISTSAVIPYGSKVVVTVDPLLPISDRHKGSAQVASLVLADKTAKEIIERCLAATELGPLMGSLGVDHIVALLVGHKKASILLEPAAYLVAAQSVEHLAHFGGRHPAQILCQIALGIPGQSVDGTAVQDPLVRVETRRRPHDGTILGKATDVTDHIDQQSPAAFVHLGRRLLEAEVQQVALPLDGPSELRLGVYSAADHFKLGRLLVQGKSIGEDRRPQDM